MTQIQIIMITLWSVILIATLLLEYFTINFISIWFSLGSLVSLFISIFVKTFWVSLIAFPIVSLIALALFIPLYKKFKIHNKKDINSFVGYRSYLLKDCDEYTLGKIKIGNTIYQTKSKNLIKKDTLVEVISVEGIKVLIKEVKN